MIQTTNDLAGRHGATASVLRLTLILAPLTAFTPFATDMYLASFPALAKSFQTNIGAVQLGLSVFFLGLAVGQLIYGPLIDRFGRRGPMLFGASIFAATSLLLAVVPTIQGFIGLRFLQAAGGCAGMIVSRAVIADLFQSREAARVMSTMMLVQGLAPIVAPMLGGYIMAAAGWRAVFLFLTCFGLLCFGIAWWGLPETLPAAHRRREGIIGVLRSFGRLLVKRDFIAPTLVSSIAFSVLFAFISGSPFVYMVLHGVSQQHYGLLFSLNALGLMAGSQINRRLLTRFSLQRVITVALAVNVLTGLLLVFFGAHAPLAVLVGLLWICVTTLPLSAANAIALAMSASGEHRGSGSAIIGVLQFLFAGVVSALIGLLHNGTAYPMTIAIMLCGMSAGLVWLLNRRAAAFNIRQASARARRRR